MFVFVENVVIHTVTREKMTFNTPSAARHAARMLNLGV